MIISIKKPRVMVIIIIAVLLPLIAISLLKSGSEKEAEPVSNIVAEPTGLATVKQDSTTKKDAGANNFFSEYRLERNRVRSKEIGLLKEIANNSAGTVKAREAANLKLIDLSGQEYKEMQAEAMIKSQGFTDCAVVINPGNITVMLTGSVTSEEKRTQVKKAVSVATGYSEKIISVIELKP